VLVCLIAHFGTTIDAGCSRAKVDNAARPGARRDGAVVVGVL